MENTGQNNQNKDFSVIKYVAGIIKEFGIPTFLLSIITILFIWSGTSEQKREFIDTFILLKNVNENPFPCVLVVVSLIFLLIIQFIYFSKMLKLRKNENNRIGKEKSELQKHILKKDLESSN